MADLVLGLAKTTVEGTVTMARSAMEEEDKLKKSVQRDLLVISDEFEMMHSFLHDAKDDAANNVTRTLVRQVRNTALDLEDCIETIVHLDNKPHWWRRVMPPCCMPAPPPEKDLDAVVATVEQLKARVDAMTHRNLRYNHTGERCHKPAEHQHAPATGAAKVAAKQSDQVEDLITLLNGKEGAEEDETRQDNNSDDKQKEGDDEIEEEEAVCSQTKKDEEAVGNEKEESGNESKVEQQKKNVQELRVISVLGTGSDQDVMFIKKAYDDSVTCKNFKCRAWVKLVHPFNPIEFIRSLLTQLKKNACPEQGNTEKVLEVMVAPDHKLVKMFETQISQRYLVVLEDLSTMVDWEAVKGFLPDNKNGSCIVVHTQHHGIAYSCVGHQYPITEREMSLANHSVIHVLSKEDVVEKVTIEEDITKDNKSNYEDWKKKNPLLGRGEDLRWLSFAGRPGCVVSVWGLPGVGKSFLIQHFYRKVQKEGTPGSYYTWKRKYWLDVPRPFVIKDVQKRLDSVLVNPAPKGHMMPTIKDPSQGDNYFIVIDGLQSTEEWDSIRYILESTTKKNDTRFCTIIITNEERVAIHCARDEKSVRNIKSLEADHAIELFNQVKDERWSMVREEDRHRIEQASNILVPKCGGFPKVICAVAESLWRFWDIKVKDNLVSELQANARLTKHSLEGMFSWLVSFFGSCPDSLKPCIFYLTIFPANHTIRRRRLLRRWIVEGYTWDKQITAEETAGEFFSRLVKLYMIQPSRGPRYPPSIGMPLCQVNGFLREYVHSWSMEENFVFELEGNCKNLQRDPGTNHHHIKGMGMGCIVQHLTMLKSWDRDRNVFESIDFSRLRSLTVFGRWESFLICDKMGRLRVLDLEDVSSGLTNGDVERMVKLLPRLKFLSLRGCREITHLPSSLGDLKQLQTLDVRETSVINLPKSITKLEKLQYIRAGRAVILDNNNTAATFGSLPPVGATANPSTSQTPAIRTPRASPGSCLSKFSINRLLYDGPDNGINVPRGIGKLSGLHTLGVVNVSAEGGKDILDELKNLTLLHKLGVYGINRKNNLKLISAISRLAHLESLSLQFQLKQDHEAAITVSPLVKLRSLKLYGLVDSLPIWFIQMRSQLLQLEKVDLDMRSLPQHELDSILTLPSLSILRLRLAEFQDGELRFGWTLADRFNRWIIKVLELSCNSRLQAVRVASKVDIEILKIRCSSASSSLEFSGLRSIRCLKEVWLSGSYDDALEKRLYDELQKSKNEDKPILKPEPHRRPLDGLSSS